MCSQDSEQLNLTRYTTDVSFTARKLWRDYFASGVDGVVFIVDAVDRARFPEAKKELDVGTGLRCSYYDETLTHSVLHGVLQALLLSDELANVPFLVLGNKIDLGNAPSEEDLRYQLGLYETYGKEVRQSIQVACGSTSLTFPGCRPVGSGRESTHHPPHRVVYVFSRPEDGLRRW
jgi:GTPase SAR1 family protein